MDSQIASIKPNSLSSICTTIITRQDSQNNTHHSLHLSKYPLVKHNPMSSRVQLDVQPIDAEKCVLSQIE